MIKVRISGKEDWEKKFNGYVVYLEVLETDGTVCERFGSECDQALTRQFSAAKIVRGAVSLRTDTHFYREAQAYVREKMGHGRSLCLSCFEKLAEKTLGGFEPAD